MNVSNKQCSLIIIETAVSRFSVKYIFWLWSAAAAVTLRMEKETYPTSVTAFFFQQLASLHLWQVHCLSSSKLLFVLYHYSLVYKCFSFLLLFNIYYILFLYVLPIVSYASAFFVPVSLHVLIALSSFSVSLGLSFSSSCHVSILRCCRGPPCSSYSRCR